MLIREGNATALQSINVTGKSYSLCWLLPNAREGFHFPLGVCDGIWEPALRATALHWLVPRGQSPTLHSGHLSLVLFPWGMRPLCDAICEPHRDSAWRWLSIFRDEQSHRPISQLLEFVQHLGVGSQVLSQVWDKIRSASNAEGQRHSSDTFFLLKRRWSRHFFSRQQHSCLRFSSSISRKFLLCHLDGVWSPGDPSQLSTRHGWSLCLAVRDCRVADVWGGSCAQNIWLCARTAVPLPQHSSVGTLCCW